MLTAMIRNAYYYEMHMMRGEMSTYPSRKADQFPVRLPDGWRDAIRARAASNRRSMNSEILAALESVVREAAGDDLAGQTPAAKSENAA